MMRSVTVVLIVSLIASVVTAQEYDYIVVGAGTSGSIVAAELAQDPTVKVLVIEKGDDASDLLSRSVLLWDGPLTGAGADSSKILTWNYFMQPHYSQETVNDLRGLIYGTPETPGGGSAVNGGAWGRASRGDMLSWNNSLWTYEATLDDWKTLESCKSGSCDPAYHGLSGPIVSNTFTPNPILTKIATAASLIFNLSFNNDTSGPVPDGIGLMARNIDVSATGAPIRQDAYSKILKPRLNLTNIDFKTRANAQALRINSNGKNELIYNHEGSLITVRAKREIILAAGAFGSSKLLMLSGIGDCTYLAKLDISCQVNNSQVGKNLQDSILSSMVYISPNTTLGTPPGAIYVGYYKSPDYVGPTTDMEVAFTSLSPFGNAYLVQLTQMHHSAQSEMKLYSKNPHRDPLVTFNIYQNASDVKALIDQLRKVRLTMASLASQGVLMIERSPGFAVLPPTATDTAIEQYFRGIVNSEGHYVGTTSLNKVVDGRLRLLDNAGEIVKGIRIADNGIIPKRLSTHSTSSSAMLIGKVASRLIKEDYQ